MASLMLGAISVSDKLISLMLQELLSGTMGTWDEGRVRAWLTLACTEQVMHVWDAPRQGE